MESRGRRIDIRVRARGLWRLSTLRCLLLGSLLWRLRGLHLRGGHMLSPRLLCGSGRRRSGLLRALLSGAASPAVLLDTRGCMHSKGRRCCAVLHPGRFDLHRLSVTRSLEQELLLHI